MKQQKTISHVKVARHRRVLTSDDIKTIRKCRLNKARYGLDDTPFKDAVAHDADLSEAHWDGEDFTRCDLRGANLSHSTFAAATFRDADLWNADLRDSDFTYTRDLLPMQLAATDLTRAQLPASLNVFEALDAIDVLSQNSSRVFITILGAAVYTFLTLGTTRDVALITNANTLKLPVIGTEIPIVGFYVVTPILLVILFFYFHIYLQRLWEAMAQLPAIFPNGRRLDEKTYPWLMNDLVHQHFPRLRGAAPSLATLQAILSIFFGYWTVPITIVGIWLTFLRAENWPITILHALAIAIAVGGSVHYSRLIQVTLGGKALRPSFSARLTRLFGVAAGVPFGCFFFLLILYCSFGVLEASEMPVSSSALEEAMNRFVAGESEPKTLFGSKVPALLSTLGIRPFPSVERENVSTKPESWTGNPANSDAELGLVRGAIIENQRRRNLSGLKEFFTKRVKKRYLSIVLAATGLDLPRLRNLRGSEAFFVESIFNDADLRRADLSSADFRQVVMTKTTARKGFFRNSLFSDKAAPADFIWAEDRSMPSDFVWNEDAFKKAHSASFYGCDFGDADFAQATFCGVKSMYCYYRPASFFYANCVGAHFVEYNLDDVSFEGAFCQKALFEPNPYRSLRGNYLRHASFESANCTGAIFISSDLSNASFKKATLAKALLSDVQLDDADFSDASLMETRLDTAKVSKKDDLLKALLKARTIYHAKLPPELAEKLKDRVEQDPHGEKDAEPESEISR
jgi:uncharacterized protein YjbI with pentapeptide repeats